jgi:hypothetical protein
MREHVRDNNDLLYHSSRTRYGVWSRNFAERATLVYINHHPKAIFSLAQHFV